MVQRQTVQTHIRRHVNVASDQGLHRFLSENFYKNLNKNTTQQPLKWKRTYSINKAGNVYSA